MAVYIDGKQVRCYVCMVWPAWNSKEKDPVLRCSSVESIRWLDGHWGPIVRYYCADHHRGPCREGQVHRWIGSIQMWEIPRRKLLERQRQEVVTAKPIVPGFVRNRDLRAKKQEEKS